MKLHRIIPKVILAVIIASMISCGTKKTTDEEVPDYKQGIAGTQGSSYVLASGLVLEALLSSPNPDLAACSQASTVHTTFSLETNALGVSGKCCCPCPPSSPGTSLRDSSHCPCPSLMMMKILAPSNAVDSITVDGIKMQDTYPPAGDSLKNAKVYQLPAGTNLSDGSHELIITGDFTGSGVRQPYKLSIELVEGKPFKPALIK